MSRYLQSFGVRRSAVLIAFFSLSLTRGFLYSVVIPPWQAPDEPGHLEYAILLSDVGRPLTRGDISPSLQREMLSSMQEFDFWKYVRQPEPEQIPDSFYDDPFLIRSGTQVGDESPLYYLFPAFIFALTGVEDILLQLYIMRWFSVLLSSATVVVSCLIADELFSKERFMIVAIPASITFLPMFTFIGASANNDSLATLVASLLIWQLVRMLRRGLSWHSGLVICALTISSVLAKKTALFTVPLVIIALPIYLWGRHVAIRDSYRTVTGASCMLATLFLGIILTWAGGDAAGWGEQPEPWMDTRSDSVAKSGGYSLHIVDDTPQLDRRLAQSLPFNLVRELRGKTLILEAWVKSARGKQSGCLFVQDSEGRKGTVFTATDTWNFQSLRYTVSSRTEFIRVVLSASGCKSEERGDLYFDDVVLLESSGDGLNLLRNGSGEVAALRAWSRLERFARHVSLRRFLDARSFDIPSLQRYVFYTLLTFAGLWANFGWLTIPLDIVWYELLASLSLVALIGLGFGSIKAAIAWRREGSKPPLCRCRGLALLFVAICLIILQTFVPMIGRDWQPQGRYMFPAIIPLATFFTFGWREVVPRRWHELLVVAWIVGFFLLDTICLLGRVYPYFHG